MKIDPMNKIAQKSVGFHLRQLLFLAKHPNFRPDPHFRKEFDEQIAEIDTFYLDDKDPRKL